MFKSISLRTLPITSLFDNSKVAIVLFAIFTVFSGFVLALDVTPVSEICPNRLSFTINGTTYNIPYCRNHALGTPSTAYNKAIIVIHGFSRNATGEYEAVKSIAQGEGEYTTTLILAPQFLRAEDLNHPDIDGETILYWGGGWSSGGDSVNASPAMSSFAVTDEIIQRIKDNFPDIRQIVVAGHSAGGQFANRYAAGTQMPDTTLYPANIDIRFIVANPSSYLYFNNERWDGNSPNPSYVFAVPTTSCTLYNSYKFGLSGLSACPYMNSVTAATIRNQYQQREVVYLLGDADTDKCSDLPDPNTCTLDESCYAMLQGSQRYERGNVYYEYIEDYFGSAVHQQQRKCIAPGVSHSSSGVYSSYYGKEFLFYAMPKPMNISAEDGLSTTGVFMTWNSVTGADSYHVRRATAPGGPWMDIGSWQTNTYYTDNSATPGLTYYYSVVAKNAARYSARGPYNTGWKKLSPPTGVSASDGAYTGKVQINWNNASGATHYRVYRAVLQVGTKTPVSGWQTGTGFDDTSATPGDSYYYWVTAAAGSTGQRQSGYSSSDTGWRKLLPPANVSASDGTYTNKVEITWDSVSGAIYYQVYRSESPGGTRAPISSWQSGTAYNDTSATPGFTYYYWVKASVSNEGSMESDYSSYDTGWQSLSVVGSLSASDGDYTDRVEITWSTVSGASHYRVYRAISSTGTKTPLASWQTAASCNDTSAVPGVTYYYWVTSATSSSGANETGFGFYNTGWRKLESVTGVSASDGTYTDKVRITWNTTTGAAYYRVFRAESSGGTKTNVGSWSSSTTCDDTSAVTGTTYYYWVTAAADSGGTHESDFSSYDTGWRKSMILPPTGVFATDGTYTDKVQITWNSSSGATHYQVSRSTSQGGTKTILSSWQTGLIYNDTTAPSGTTCYYWVKAASGSDGAGAGSYSSFDTGWRIFTPPTGLEASDGTHQGAIVLDWNAVSGASHYKVYYGTAQFGSKTPLSNWQAGTQYTHTNPIPGETYWYWITAAADSGGARESDYSSVDDGWSPLSPPQSVVVSDGTFADKVVVTWPASPGADYYQVYRAATPTSAKTALNNWQAGNSYDDTTAIPGVTYYYWVKAAVGMSGWRSTDYSSSDSGWCLLSIGFDLASSDGLETDSITNIKVVLSNPTTAQKTVNYSVTGGTAANGTDYNLSAGTFVFQPGQTTKIINANIIYNAAPESDETIEITLSSPGGGNVILSAITQHTYTILDNTLYRVCPDGSGDFTTIQAGINAASDRDVVQLCDAVYVGSGNRDIDYLGKAITVRSQSGNPENCVIDCQGLGRGFKFVNDENVDSVLEGITITNGVGSMPGGGGILCGVYIAFPFPVSHYGSPTINNCIISNNYMAGNFLNPAGGGGIYICENSSPVLNDCLFKGNSTGGLGATSLGGAMYCKGSSPTLTDCTFIQNNAGNSGGALMGQASNFVLYGCVFKDNSANLGGAVLCNGSGGTFQYCLFYDNTANIDGGAIYCTGTSLNRLMMNNCTLYGNSAPYGSGIFLHTNSLAALIDNTIISHGIQGQAVDSYSSSATMTCCDVYANAGGDWVGAIAGQGTLRNNISLDPLFCNPANQNFYLRSNSPCLPFSAPNPSCDLIGAWPLGYPADLNINGSVDLSDFANFALYWYQTGCGVCGGADLTGDDGQVGPDDLMEFIIYWLEGTQQN